MTHEPEGFSVNEDASVNDVTAQRQLEKNTEEWSTLPKDRLPADHSYGTPGQIDEATPDNVHSDGGPTVFTDEQVAASGVAELEPEGITLEELRPELFKDKKSKDDEPIDESKLDSSDEPVSDDFNDHIVTEPTGPLGDDAVKLPPTA